MAALGNDRVLIGAPDVADIGTNRSAAYLFNTNGTLLATFANQRPKEVDAFGISVAILGRQDQVLVWSHQRRHSWLTNEGAAYMFSTNGTLLGTFTKPSPTTFSEFGTAIAGLGTNKFVVGAYQDSTGASDAGAAYVFGMRARLTFLGSSAKA